MPAMPEGPPPAAAIPVLLSRRTAVSLKAQLTDDMKAAMKGGDDRAPRRHPPHQRRDRNSARVDERIVLDDAQVLSVLERCSKQRQGLPVPVRAAGRADLAAVERFEMEVIRGYLPAPLSAAEIDALIVAAIAESGASSARDMGKVIAALKPRWPPRRHGGARAW